MASLINGVSSKDSCGFNWDCYSLTGSRRLGTVGIVILCKSSLLLHILPIGGYLHTRKVSYIVHEVSLKQTCHVVANKISFWERLPYNFSFTELFRAAARRVKIAPMLANLR